MFHRPKGEDDHNDSNPGHLSVLWLARRAIVAAKLHWLRGELICHAVRSVEDYAKPVADAARWPQAPLILGDKWDF